MLMRVRVVALGGVVAAVTLAGCGDSANSSARSSASTKPPATATAAADTATVLIKEVQFKTALVHVRAGGNVTFDNQDTQPHTATADDNSFDSDAILDGAKKTVTLSKAGTFTYHCAFHPFMKGTVIVG